VHAQAPGFRRRQDQPGDDAEKRARRVRNHVAHIGDPAWDEQLSGLDADGHRAADEDGKPPKAASK
jgi:hypothetical protein